MKSSKPGSRWAEETYWQQPAWDEVAIGLEIGVQPRVEIRCVKQTGCCVKSVDPQMHPWVTHAHTSAFSSTPLPHCHIPPPPRPPPAAES